MYEYHCQYLGMASKRIRKPAKKSRDCRDGTDDSGGEVQVYS
jgi:hypothetical protein